MPEVVSVGAVAAGQSTVPGHVCVADPPFTNLSTNPHNSSEAVGLLNVQLIAPPAVAVTELPAVKSIVVLHETLPNRWGCTKD
mgnify:CR=1 FL=1